MLVSVGTRVEKPNAVSDYHGRAQIGSKKSKLSV